MFLTLCGWWWALTTKVKNGFTLTHPSLISLVVSVDVKHHVHFTLTSDVELRSCGKSQGSRSGFPVFNANAVIVLIVSVDVKQH